MPFTKEIIAKEFARRKIQFHFNEDWHNIKCFGLFQWGDISRYLFGNPSNIKTFKEGLLITDMKKENKIIWCQPTEEFWKKDIQPIIDSLSHIPYNNQVQIVMEWF